MTRLHPRWFAAAALFSVLAACGDDRAGEPVDAGEPPRQSTKVLTRVGPGVIEAHPGDKLTLQALLAMGEIGPIADGPVDWKLLNDPGETLLQDARSVTNDAGVAENSVTLGTEGQVVIRAESTGAAGKAVWKINVVPIVKYLKIVDTPEVTVTDTTSSSASVAAVTGRPVTLRVRVSTQEGDREAPVSSESVTFAFQTMNAGAEFQGNPSGLTQTRGDGEASVILSPGRASPTPYTIFATIAGGISAHFDIVVRGTGGGTGGGGGNTGPSGTNCASSDRPCPLGYTCDPTSGLCKPGFGNGCEACPTGPACTSQNECTNGTVCADGNCKPPGVHCDTATNQCVPDDPCSSNVDCPTGFACQNGVCVPPVSDAIDVTGHWFTKHEFNIGAALPSWVTGIVGKGVRIVDQILHAQLQINGVPSWIMNVLNTVLIGPIVQAYVPDWVVKLVSLLDNVLTLFSKLRAEGEMDLVQNGGPRILAGTESWNSFIFYLLAQCLPAVPSDPTPACARVDIYSSVLPADATVTLSPFSAKVAGTSPNNTFVVDSPRLANMKLSRFIKWVFDYAVQLTLGYPSLEDKPCPANCRPGNTDANGNPCPDPANKECGPGSGALSQLIDCTSVGQDLSDSINAQFGFTIDPSIIAAGCQLGVTAAGNLIAQQLTNITVSSDVLEFTGEAAARATNGNPNYADELGWPDFETRNPPDGKWQGKFRVGVTFNNVPGRWRASRNPVSTP